MTSKPKRWPYRADRARRMAIDAAEDAIDALIDVAGAMARGDQEAMLAALKMVNRKLNFVITTLVRAKYGELPETTEEESIEDLDVR